MMVAVVSNNEHENITEHLIHSVTNTTTTTML